MNQTKLSIPPISEMKDSLSAVFKYCEQADDGETNYLAEMGIGSFGQLNEAATMAHWISTKPELMLKADLEIYFPIQIDGDAFEVNAVLSRTELAMSAVAWLLGRDPKRTTIHLIQLRSLDVKHINGCKNGVWREEGGKPGAQCGDAVWLGYLDPQHIHGHYSLSEDLAHVVRRGVPVGLAVLDETAKSVGRGILMMAGYDLSPQGQKQKLSEESALWEEYRHSDRCVLSDSHSYTLNIVGVSAPEDDLKALITKMEAANLAIKNYMEDRSEAVILHECWDCNITAMIGSIIKCSEDLDPGERYQILTEDYMIRLSDGVVLLLGLTDDLRGSQEFKIDRSILLAYPGIESEWINRLDWGNRILDQYKSDMGTPMMTRASRLQAIKFLKGLKAGLTVEAGAQLEEVWNASMPQNHPMNGAARILFGLLDKQQLSEAKGVLFDNPEIINTVDSDGDSPLMRAVDCGDLELFKTCLELKADVNFKGDDGFRPLHIAARNGFTTMCEKLIDNGAEINAVTPLGWTAVMLANQSDHKGCVNMLVRRGAETNRDHRAGIAALLAKNHGISRE